MGRKAAALFVAELVLVVGAGYALKVEHRSLSSFDFESVETYAIKPRPANSPPRFPETASRILGLVESELQQRGWKQVALDESPDVVVATEGFIRDENPGFDYSPDRVDYITVWDDPSFLPLIPRLEGVLVIELVDPDSGKMVWAGWAIEVGKTIEKVTRKADTAVQKIFRRFPIEAR